MSYIVLDEKTMQAQCCMTRQDVLEFFLRQEGNRKNVADKAASFRTISLSVHTFLSIQEPIQICLGNIYFWNFSSSSR